MTYVLSDIHGDYEKYRAILRAVSFGSGDTLYVLGDVIDHGPDGVRILRDMMARHNVIPLLGNHEFSAAICIPLLLRQITRESISALDSAQIAALNDWMSNGGRPTIDEIKRLRADAREELLEYIRDMELYAEVKAGTRRFVLVHAGINGFVPGKPLDGYELSDFLFGCPDPEREYFAGKLLVHGHTPTRLLRQAAGEAPADRIFRRGNQIAIDCGCAIGGSLGCLCLDTLEEFYA